MAAWTDLPARQLLRRQSMPRRRPCHPCDRRRWQWVHSACTTALSARAAILCWTQEQTHVHLTVTVIVGVNHRPLRPTRRMTANCPVYARALSPQHNNPRYQPAPQTTLVSTLIDVQPLVHDCHGSRPDPRDECTTGSSSGRRRLVCVSGARRKTAETVNRGTADDARQICLKRGFFDLDWTGSLFPSTFVCSLFIGMTAMTKLDT